MIYQATEENITKAGDLIKSGELVAFPTETVYGLGANAFNAEAVQKIFDLKERPNYNPLIVHLTSIDQIEEVSTYKDTPRLVVLLERVKKFWPGPLSVILPKKPAIPSVVTGGLDTVAIRLPNHPIARALIQAAQCPIAAPSANKFMHISPTKAQHVEDSLGEELFILDGGSTTVGLESTVISLVPETPQLLRPGFITFEDLSIALDNNIVHGEKVSSHPASPGMLRKHYSPSTPLRLRSKVECIPNNCGLISFNKANEHDLSKFKEVIFLSQTGSLEDVSANLFAALYKLDSKHLDLILIDSCSEEGLGLAIMDRISRATAN